MEEGRFVSLYHILSDPQRAELQTRRTGSNVVAESLALLLHISEVLSSNLGLECAILSFLFVSLSPYG
jgi:hypothetical protein